MPLLGLADGGEQRVKLLWQAAGIQQMASQVRHSHAVNRLAGVEGQRPHAGRQRGQARLQHVVRRMHRHVAQVGEPLQGRRRTGPHGFGPR